MQDNSEEFHNNLERFFAVTPVTQRRGGRNQQQVESLPDSQYQKNVEKFFGVDSSAQYQNQRPPSYQAHQGYGNQSNQRYAQPMQSNQFENDPSYKMALNKFYGVKQGLGNSNITDSLDFFGKQRELAKVSKTKGKAAYNPLTHQMLY